MTRLYLIAATPDFGDRSNDDSAIGFSEPYAMNAAAGIATVAAYFPDDFQITLCDEIVQAVDFDHPAEVVGISLNVAQAPRAIQIAREFRARGRTVVMGGAHVSLAPELFEGQADCLVIGEFEAIADEFVADLRAGTLKSHYRAGRADLARSIPPRWDLYPNERALAGVVQTSRGCPFDCHFCDVIQYLGRAQRHKPPEHVQEEVQRLYDLGYRQINLSDDNFTVYRRRTMELLAVLADWNGRDGREPVDFFTQMSVDVARAPEVLAACNAAGLRCGFVGIESSSPEALKESRKRQNLHRDLVCDVTTIVSAGVAMQAGLIVGFDHDDLSCFERQFEFAMSLPVVLFRVSVLTAPIATPLFAQMQAQGRILDPPGSTLVGGGGSTTNFQPMQMSREQVTEGAEWLRRSLFDPDNAIVRFQHLARVLADRPEHLQPAPKRAISRRAKPLLELFARMSRDPGGRRVIDCVQSLCVQRPAIRADLMQALGTHLNSYLRQAERDAVAGTSSSVRVGTATAPYIPAGAPPVRSAKT